MLADVSIREREPEKADNSATRKDGDHGDDERESRRDARD